MKFDFAIGNPPYNQEFTDDGNKTFAAPVYHEFLNAAFSVANKVELIHPARFLFNAGSTPKAWNEKMLADPHFKVLSYEEDASKVFSNTDIKGGIAVTYHDVTRNYDAIGVFTAYPELNSILHKVIAKKPGFLDKLVVSGYAYHFTDKMHEENPTIRSLQSKGHEYDLKSNIIEKLPTIFLKSKPNTTDDYIEIAGRAYNERVIRFVRATYINKVVNLGKFKVFLPSGNGAGNFGEALAPNLIGYPQLGHTESFISLGCFDTEFEAISADKYMHTKFARCMLGIKKKTQHLTPETFKYVPNQNFTENSDIAWGKTIKNIDQQLYKKYGLSVAEIDFIEKNVKEMN